MSRRFEKVLEAATDQTLVEPNWESILECVDMIRGSDVGVKQAVQSIQKRYHNENPHVAHHSLLVLEACVKNCGKRFHAEIATKEFMDDLKNIVIEGAPDKVKNKVLELIQCWSSAFANSPEYKIVCDTHSFLKMYGFEFPKLKEADAMFVADSAPEWADGESCFRCRVEFGMFTRKHHCRSCGQIFCDRCSSRQMFLPRFGIEKKVRTCETCYSKNNDAATQKIPEKIAQNGQRNGDPNAAAAEEARQRELKEKEEEELQLALAISMSEAEAKEKSRQTGLYHQFGNNSSTSAPPKSTPAEPKLVNGSNTPSEYSYVYRGIAQDPTLPAAEEDDDLDPALSRYLDKRYWEQRQAARDAESVTTLNNGNIRATAPPPSEMSFSTSSDNPTINDYAYSTFNNGAFQPQIQATVAPNGVSNGFDFNQASSGIDQKMANLSLTPTDEVEQTAAYCKNLREQVEIMDNRMRSNLMRGRSVVNDSAIHSLFTKLTNVHADVLERMNKLDEDRELYESMQDKLGYIQEARQALTSLREEHIRQRQERLQEEARLRMQQMQSKLEEIRHKKYENLMEQRQMALQRLQQEEQRLQEARQIAASPQVPQMSMPHQMPQVSMPPQNYVHPPQQHYQIPPQNQPYPNQQMPQNFVPQPYTSQPHNGHNGFQQQNPPVSYQQNQPYIHHQQQMAVSMNQQMPQQQAYVPHHPQQHQNVQQEQTPQVVDEAPLIVFD